MWQGAGDQLESCGRSRMCNGTRGQGLPAGHGIPALSAWRFPGAMLSLELGLPTPPRTRVGVSVQPGSGPHVDTQNGGVLPRAPWRNRLIIYRHPCVPCRNFCPSISFTRQSLVHPNRCIHKRVLAEARCLRRNIGPMARGRRADRGEISLPSIRLSLPTS